MLLLAFKKLVYMKLKIEAKRGVVGGRLRLSELAAQLTSLDDGLHRKEHSYCSCRSLQPRDGPASGKLKEVSKAEKEPPPARFFLCFFF
jgi:hypothetical protein